MKLNLTPTQAATLRLAPNDWAALPANAVISTLRQHGLVVVRDAPGERTLNRGFQWMITLSGLRQEGRKLQPKTEPEVISLSAAMRVPIHSASTGHKTPA